MARPDPVVAARFGPRSEGTSSAIKMRQWTCNFRISSFKSLFNIKRITCITHSAVLKFSCDLLSLLSLFVFSFLLLQFHPLNSKASQSITKHHKASQSITKHHNIWYSYMYIYNIYICSQFESLRVMLASKIFQASCRRSFMLRLCCGSVHGYHIATQLSGHTSWSLDQNSTTRRFVINLQWSTQFVQTVPIKHAEPNDKLHKTEHREQHSQATRETKIQSSATTRMR